MCDMGHALRANHILPGNRLMLDTATMTPIKDARLNLRIEKPLLALLDDLRRAEKDVPSRGEMVSRLIKRAAEAKAKKKPEN